MWLDMTNIQSGPLFPKLTVSKTSLPDLQYGTFNGTARNAERMGPKVKALFNYVLGKKVLRDICGHDGGLTAHCIRVSGVDAALRVGASVHDVADAGRWESINTLYKNYKRSPQDEIDMNAPDRLATFYQWNVKKLDSVNRFSRTSVFRDASLSGPANKRFRRS